MPLPAFDSRGDLPEGVHPATLAEVIARFGHGTPQRQRVTARLRRLYDLAYATDKLLRFVIFGSYITAKPKPNDIDIILIMRDDFLLPECHEETSPVFHHLQAQAELGASVFWTVPQASCWKPLTISSHTGKANETRVGTALLKSSRR